jgi:hypothetical protein
MAADVSMAIWCVHRLGSSGATSEVHFNYWWIAGETKDSSVRDFAEIGVMVSDPRSIEKICIYLPSQVEPQDVSDCGRFFAEPHLAQGIFNEPLASVNHPSGRVELHDLDGKQFCRVHIFPPNGPRIDAEHLSVDALDRGTLLTITKAALDSISQGMSSADRGYFRLRIFFPDRKKVPFVTVHIPPDRWLQSGFDEVTYADFRLNEARTLPLSIETLMRPGNGQTRVELKLVAFLTAVPLLAELSQTNGAIHKSRVLEHQLWEKYVPSGLPQGMMVYHWRTENGGGIEDFSAFVKLRRRRSNRKTLFGYLIFAFVFAVLGSLTAAGIEGLASRNRQTSPRAVSINSLATPDQKLPSSNQKMPP